jgi:mannose-6-phosphate isomerase
LKEKVWGGHKLERLLGLPSTDQRIGEAWLVFETLRIDNGRWRGQTLAELVRQYPQFVPGEQAEASIVHGEHHFPLLAKFIDSREWLSVQVHPDDRYARAREGMPFGKCEAWYVIDAEPGAQIIHGLSQSLTREKLTEAARTGALKSMMDYVDLRAGMVVMNMPGTIHAIGSGLVIYEIQQSSDITYRLYDWDRPASIGRELHHEPSGDVSHYDPISQHIIQPLTVVDAGVTRTYLAACRYFAAEKLQITSSLHTHTRSASFHMLTVLDGAGIVRSDGAEPEVELSRRESVVLPASLGAYEITPTTHSLTVIDAYVPDLRRDVIQPLMAKGFSPMDIALLGGDLERSDLRMLMNPDELRATPASAYPDCR